MYVYIICGEIEGGQGVSVLLLHCTGLSWVYVCMGSRKGKVWRRRRRRYIYIYIYITLRRGVGIVCHYYHHVISEPKQKSKSKKKRGLVHIQGELNHLSLLLIIKKRKRKAQKEKWEPHGLSSPCSYWYCCCPMWQKVDGSGGAYVELGVLTHHSIFWTKVSRTFWMALNLQLSHVLVMFLEFYTWIYSI